MFYFMVLASPRLGQSNDFINHGTVDYYSLFFGSGVIRLI